jgi:uncharacterized protein
VYPAPRAYCDGLRRLQRLRAGGEFESAPLLAASIFLDVLNVFEFFLTLFGRSRD